MKLEPWFWILGWSLSILTMTGNGFVIFIVCRKRQLRTKTNAFIVSLAVADFFVGMSSVPPLFFCDITSGCNFQAGGVSFKAMAFIGELFLYASAVNLCSLVLDRYMAIVRPLTYLTFMKRRRVVQMISVSWTISVSFTVFIRTLSYSSKRPLVINVVGWFCVVLELCLCFIVIFCFASMLSVVCKHDRSARALAKQLRFNHHVLLQGRDKSAVKMMAVVIGLFLMCYGIVLHCSFVLILSDHQECNDVQYKFPLLVLNSAVNPLAYAVFKRDIKREIKRLVFFVILKRGN